MKKAAAFVRRALLAAAGNEGLFMFLSFFVTGVLTMGPLYWYQEQVNLFDRYVLIPWGMALCLLRLERSARLERPRRDLMVLFVLAAWVVVPFALRFGLTFNNISSWHGFIVAYFGIYAATSEEPLLKRENLLDLASALFTLLSLVLGAALLYCAATAQLFGEGTGEFAFGVARDGILRMGQHHNTTGMIAMLCALMSLLGFCRRKNALLRAVHLLAAGMMSLVVILSQSRTSRYALLAAFAVGCYGALASGSWNRRAAVRHGAGLLAGVMILAGGYLFASEITDAALAHYTHVWAGDQQACVQLFAAAEAQEDAQTEAQTEAQTKAPVKAVRARGAGDASFTGRTLIWKNLLKLWRENPKYFIIGNGVGRTGSRIVEGTMLEEGGSATAHNTYLQFTADFGLIGFLLLAAFLCMQAAPCLRVLYACGEQARPGDRVLCMIVVACLLTGFMESDPLSPMRFCNVVLLFAFAQLMARSRDMQSPCVGA